MSCIETREDLRETKDKPQKYIVGIRYSEYDGIGEFDSLEAVDKFIEKNKTLLDSGHVIQYWIAKVLFEG